MKTDELLLNPTSGFVVYPQRHLGALDGHIVLLQPAYHFQSLQYMHENNSDDDDDDDDDYSDDVGGLYTSYLRLGAL